MLADPRPHALVSNFAGQWLQLRNVRTRAAELRGLPGFRRQPAAGASSARPSCSSRASSGKTATSLDLLGADYTFVNERLARHYGMPNIYGSLFRRVPVTDEARKGLLGHGSILALTSHAERTSPVLRGKWILENLLGSPPPPPPADVPALSDKTEQGADRSANGWSSTARIRCARAVTR